MKFHKINGGYVSEDKKFLITRQSVGWVIMRLEGIVNGREWYCTTHTCCKLLRNAKLIIKNRML